MDAVDSRILELLQTNSRITMSEMGRIIGMTPPAVTERVRKLEDKGVISTYRAVLAPEKLGKGIAAFILLQSYSCSEINEFCKNEPDVIDLYRISGQHNFLLKVRTKSMEAMEEFTNRLGAYGNSTTLIVLSTRFEQKALVPDIEE
ncbi:Lrp/AsnC family transcriptional regulator [Brevibacillus fluminis]|uniref:Lrp/AsnC family transcriptional regulator n=1 Tax=Brevibacillus fluminis TaxID=511487 RepID=A0A3M8DHS8_9BACL|nr:AsnC family transcriptional regulator [Brevibacillus fluminis]RNB87149.1 Lrp/AsnC family transcriptional regulator [Brevibacillus fluminis]